ncbi:MAG TPA: GNAT family N-acetyltransferase [Casimicrobiaceae bacterium]|nr:GNAT family N-acetyltransferase [Casimicrobiaceae bacterium]
MISQTEALLDNPIWASLGARHAHFALGDGLARRYRPEISPLAGVAGDDAEVAASLAAVVQIGDDIAIFGPAPPLGANWEVLREARITQMIRRDEVRLAEASADVLTLGAADVAEMLELVELTEPGPFRSRTIELGTYIGIREGERLVALAGERMWIGDYREVSAICTHPDVRGRGYAHALISRVVNRMLEAAQVPFLHVFSTNTRAIDVYLKLGFVRRAEFPLLHARRIR